MHLLALTTLLVAATAFPKKPQAYKSPDAVDLLAQEGLQRHAQYQKKINSTCTLENASRRQEWSDMSPSKRKEYIAAVLCLQSKPAKSTAFAPGARSRYDDFIAAHMNQTLTIHGTGNFLTWHRYFLWNYEKALKEECGYKGYQPYWNWGKYAADPINSAIFDGSPTSLGGNGAPYNHTGIPFIGAPPPYDIIPPSVGGGCVTTGPFANMSVNLGPMAATISGVPKNSRPDGYGFNPRCLRRDVNVNSAAVTTTNYTYDLITNKLNSDIYWFQTVLQGQFDIGKWGVHAGGHFTIGGDPGGDFYTSPGDPAFWLHHGMVDRVYWIWQTADLAKRQAAVSGLTALGVDPLGNQVGPPGANTTLTDDVDLGPFVAPAVKLGSLMSTMGGLGGEFCYVYV